MKKGLILIGMELKYLLRQKFLWILLLVGIVLTAYQAPRFHYHLEYSFYSEYNESHSTEGMNDIEKANIAYWQDRLDKTLEERRNLYERAVAAENEVEKESGFEWEYLKAVEKLYEEELPLEIQDYLGWEIALLQRTGMAPHNFSLLQIMIIVSAGLLLMTKDKENGTLFWASITGRGVQLPAYLLRIGAVLIYGFCIQMFFIALYIFFCCLSGLDMRHLLSLVQHVSQYGMCDLRLSILGLYVVDIVLKCVVSVMIFLFVLLAACVVKRYIFLFLGGLAVSGVLYYIVYTMCNNMNYSLLWRMNPFSIFQLDRFLKFQAVNIWDHAVDVRLLVLSVWSVLLLALVGSAYWIWRKFLYGNRT